MVYSGLFVCLLHDNTWQHMSYETFAEYMADGASRHQKTETSIV
jgi:hypothetical protein